MRITDLIITPIAFRDPPLLNSWGVHEPLALRTIVQLVVDDSVVGLGEGSGEASVLQNLRQIRDALIGLSPFDLNGIERVIDEMLRRSPSPTSDKDRRGAFSIVEVACFDAQGKLTGLRVCDLLGGAVRETVPYSAYLFYKWAGHPGADGTITTDDRWGAALDPAGIVRQAHLLIDDYGFQSIKLKAGVFEPAAEIEAMRALAAEFPGYPLRIDPNGAWSVETSLSVARQLEGVLEYLEDPTLGTAAMAEVSAATTLPLATNMCVVSFDTIPQAVRLNAVQIVLSDHHYWGGLRHTRELAQLCDTFGLGLSMHSNSHLGISLAAMTHVAAATPQLAYACDTHYPWNASDDVVLSGSLSFESGSLAVPGGAGLGVSLDHDKLGELHELYVASGRTSRDDTAYMRRIDAAYDPTLPRF